MEEYKKPKKLRGSVHPLFNQHDIAKIASAVNYNADILQLVLYRLEQLENNIFQSQAESEEA